jgi:hypothetical protein
MLLPMLVIAAISAPKPLTPFNTSKIQYCTKQIATMKYNGKEIGKIPIKEPVCSDSKEAIQILLQSKQTGILSLPDEKNCAPVIVIVQPTPEKKFFLNSSPLCATKGSVEQFREEFMNYEFDIKAGEIYEKP